MNEEEFEDLFDQSFQNIFGKDDDEIVLKELEQRASSFKDAKEIIEYMESLLEKVSTYNKAEALKILFQNLKIETIEENFEELLSYLNVYKKRDDWYFINAVESIIKQLPEEIKFQRFEELCDFILDEENKMSSNDKLSIIAGNLPVNFKQPERYRDILETIGKMDDSYYKDAIRKRIILELPKEFVIENYEEVSQEFFITNNVFLGDCSRFANRVFDTEGSVEDERINEIFTVFKTQLDGQPNNRKEIIYKAIIEYLPRTVIKQQFEELLPFIDEEKYSIFWSLDDGQTDNAWLQENLSLLVDAIKRENKYNYIIENVQMQLIEQLPESFIKENGVQCFELLSSGTYKELVRIVFDEPEEKNYDALKNTIVWLGENSLERFEGYDYKKRELFEMIADTLPADFVQKNLEVLTNTFYFENFENLYSRIFEISENEKNDSELMLKNLTIMADFIKSKSNYNYITTREYKKIIEYLPEEFIQENLEVCINVFNFESFENLYSKALSTTESEQVNSDLIEGRTDLFLKHLEKLKLEPYRLKEEHKKIIEVLPKEFIKNNMEFCFSRFDKSAYFTFLSKGFLYEEGENADSEDIKKRLEQVKQKIDEKFDYDNVFDKIDADKCWNEVIAVLPKEFIKENSEFVVSLLGKKIPEKSRVYLLESIPEDVIKEHEEKLVTKISLESIGTYQRYLEYIMTTPNMSIVTSSIGIKILEFLNSNPNNDDQNFLKIKELLEQEKSKYEMPDMSKYVTYLPEKYSEMPNSMDEKTFEEFIDDLERIKLLTGSIPEEYCDYVIKQKLTKDSILNQDLNKYLPMLKRVFEDKVKHLLLKDGIDGYTIEFFEKDGNTLGYHNKTTRTIGFLEDNLLELDESNSHIINTAYHEVRHAIQAKHYSSTDFTKLDGLRYNMIKEEIIRDDERYFYDRNYTRMYCEIDARLAGTRGQAEYLKFLGISEEQIIENVGSTTKTLKDIVEEKKKEEQVNTDYASNKVDRDGKIVSISQKASELIKKNPDWLKKYPVLALEFDENGERRKTPEILSNAISCGDSSIRDIYLKIFENGISVSLDDSAETLEYISRLLETREGYDEDIVNFVSLIVKNETFESLRDADINDIECKRVLFLLNKMSTDNPDLEISEYIKEKLEEFARDGKINIETKKDTKISDSAISTMLQRNIKTREEFERLLKDLPKVMIDKENKDYKLGYGFGNVFEKYFKNDPTIDFNELLEMVLETVSDANRVSIIEYSWDSVPDELRMNHIQGFIDLSSKYRTIDLEFAYSTFSKISKEDIDKNPNLAKTLFGEYLEPEIFPSFKIPKNRKELESVIEELKNNNVKDERIEDVIKVAMLEERKKGTNGAIEMLYIQLDFLKKDYEKSSAISSFFIYTPKEFQKEHLTQILRYTLLEKEHFDENTVNDIIKYTKLYARDEIFEENPDILLEIEEIQKQALEKAKTKVTDTKGTSLSASGKTKIATIEEFEERLQILKKDNPEDWNFTWEVSRLFKENFDKESELDYNLMLSMSLELVSEKRNKEKLIEYYWDDMPEEMRLDNIKKYVEVSSKYTTIDFKFAANTLGKFSKEEIEKNPNFAEEIFGEYLKPGELPFLLFPKNIDELDAAIRDAESRGANYYDIKKGIEVVVETQIKNGNPESEGLLYRQLEFGQYQYNKKYAMSIFFIYANSNLLREKGEAVLRHALIEKAYFDEENITNVIDDARKSAEEKHPDMLPIIDEIHRQALEKTKQTNLVVDEISVDLEPEPPKDVVSATDTEKEEVLALQEIRDSVPANEISTGKKMIQMFLTKAKEMKNKIGKFFGGGDDHDNR